MVNQREKTPETRKARTKQDNTGRERCNDCRITALLHNRINDWDGKATQDSGESTHSNKRNVIYRVTIPNVFELELSIEAYKPTSQTKQHFGERRVNIKVVLSWDIVRRKFSKMDFIKTAYKKPLLWGQASERGGNLHNLVWMIDFIEPERES